ncbi:hypothetical protein DES45_11355 [Microvirga subterranea]|uniref:Uncharacterized protein n=2 Tax=Microvirga subterranea TaxID=186651 RepID=A0A370HA02_9HYPH|nr:hypothetical protein DES45_11355 [Microvirga subterranea]
MEECNSVASLIERLKRKAPAYLDLLTAETEEEFESAFSVVLEKAVHHLEKNKVNFAELKEEGLSGALAGALTIPGLTVTQETNSNGHVDLTIEADHCNPSRIKLGEAKIYAGPSYHIKGIGQLLGRYTTGREGQGLLINYVRNSNIKAITAKLKTEMDAKLPENQTELCAEHTLKWSLVTKHQHSSGEIVAIGHIGCNLYV